MKAYELMKLALENSQEYEGRRYKTVKGSAFYAAEEHFRECIIYEGCLVSNNAMRYDLAVYNDTEVEEIPQSVDFITASNSMKRIKPEKPHKDAIITDRFYYLDTWLFWFGGSSGTYNKFNCLEFINGKWLIEP
jgi:hypothetical protein